MDDFDRGWQWAEKPLDSCADRRGAGLLTFSRRLLIETRSD
jgi:hypothetical protein